MRTQYFYMNLNKFDPNEFKQIEIYLSPKKNLKYSNSRSITR